MTCYIGYHFCCDIPEGNSLVLDFIWTTQITFVSIPLTKDIFNSIIEYTAHIKDLSVHFVLFKLITSFSMPYRNANCNTTLEYYNVYQTAFELLILKCFEKISHKLIHTIHLSLLHLLHFLHAGCDAFSLGFNLIKSPPEVLVPVAIFSIVHFAFPFALAFLSFQAQFLWGGSFLWIERFFPAGLSR